MYTNKLKFFLSENIRNLLSFITIERKVSSKIEYLTVEANQAFFNNTKDSIEIIIIAGGKGGMTVNGEKSFLIHTGDIIYMPQNSIRSFANIENEILNIILITIT